MTNLQFWVCVENNVVMITASVPALKPLFGRKIEPGASSFHYDNTYELGRTGGSGAVSSAAWNKSRQSRKWHSDIAMTFADTQSEEHILSDEQDVSRITKTMDVDVSYANRGDTNEIFKGTERVD